MLSKDEIVYQYTAEEFETSMFGGNDYDWTLINSFSYNKWVHRDWSEYQYRVFQSRELEDEETGNSYHIFKVTESITDFVRFDVDKRKERNRIYITQTVTGAKHVVQKQMLFMISDFELDERSQIRINVPRGTSEEEQQQ